jgi:hypothetical protein
MNDDWVSDIEPGNMLLVQCDTPLYPHGIWNTLVSDDTWLMSMPTLRLGDQVVVVDVLPDERNSCNVAALVVTHLGIGCVMLLNSQIHFKKI